MKKYLILIVFMLIPFNVFASTNTNVRTEENLLVPNDIKVTDNNKNNILSTPSVNETEKIYDFAGVINDFFEEKIYDDIVSFNNKKNIDLFVVSINDIGGKSIDNYAKDFYQFNNFGFGDKRDCIEIIIYNNQPYIYGYGNSIKHYNNLNNCLDDFDESKGGAAFGLIRTITNLDFQYKTNVLNSKLSKLYFGVIPGDLFTFIFIFVTIISFVITLFIVGGMIASSHLVIPDRGAKNSLNEDTVKTNVISDRVTGSSTSRSTRLNSNKKTK